MNAFTAADELAFETGAKQSKADRVAVPGGRPNGSRFAAALSWIVEMPRRRAVINELQSLSDHELADIGLERAEVSRVFDRGSAAQRPAL